MKLIQYDMLEDYKYKLRDVLGLEVQLIYADRIIKEYQKSVLEASYLIIKFGKSKQLKISTSWFECVDTLDSYYKFIIEDINFSIESDETARSIFSFGNSGEIKNILNVKKELKDDFFCIVHSCGILIERSDFKRILICGGESAFQNITLCDDEKKILKFLKGKQLESLGN